MEIKVTQRSVQGTGASRRLRRQGRVPGIVYGGGAEALAIELDHNEIYHKLRQESFHSSILTMKMDDKTEQALLRDVQMHPFKPIVLHVDFQRVNANEKIHMKVPLHFVNGDISPAVKLSGAIISHIFNEVEVLCLPQNLPEFIEVDLKELTVGHSLHLADVKAPSGIEFVAVVKGENPAVVSAVLPRAAKADDDNAPVVSAADVPAANQKAPANPEK
ncbi:MAG: 50S ribosomal protein L25/general stress protein Ctc [Betaproteobacteria bacterium]|nr:50S ribosomal protein L25/general stress protein Ctc [Betaproteobacteria bacterium]MDE2423038.1 50S ribosomal protein L25/general stress protein Ctc [Betaproteobacteria bacterium]